MIAIVSRATQSGAIATVGTSDRTVVRGYKTILGVLRFARHFSLGRAHQIDFFHDSEIYGSPFKTIVKGAR